MELANHDKWLTTDVVESPPSHTLEVQVQCIWYSWAQTTARTSAWACAGKILPLTFHWTPALL